MKRLSEAEGTSLRDSVMAESDNLADGAAMIGQEMFELICRLYPICRSITGDGVRSSLKILQQYIPLEICEIPSGTQVLDWTIPKEWNVKDAYVKNPQGKKIIDFGKSNLHLLSYSAPVKLKLPLAELKKHLHTLPDCPDWIPYRTSYYNDNWGFCLSYKELLKLSDGDYEVVIDSALQPGHLTYGECLIKGETDSEVLISTHICHPSLANDNLSGVALSTFLAKSLITQIPKYSYRFLFTPGTIGSIAWLAFNEARVSKIRHGLVLACVGDAGKITYKKSRRGDAEMDRAVKRALKDSGNAYEILDFSPYGYDERQFCSPGFNLPVGCLMRTPHGSFREYHTSADDLQFVKPGYLADSFSKCVSIFGILEYNQKFLNLNPKCEPQLGRRGLYRNVGGDKGNRDDELALLWVLNMSDGDHSLLDIAEKSDLEFSSIKKAAHLLRDHSLLKAVVE